MIRSGPREVRQLSECHTANTSSIGLSPASKNGKMQVLGNQVCVGFFFNYSLISKKVIFKQEAASPWDFFF